MPAHTLGDSKDGLALARQRQFVLSMTQEFSVNLPQRLARLGPQNVAQRSGVWRACGCVRRFGPLLHQVPVVENATLPNRHSFLFQRRKKVRCYWTMRAKNRRISFLFASGGRGQTWCASAR